MNYSEIRQKEDTFVKRKLYFLTAVMLLCAACTSKTPAPVSVTESPTEVPEETPIALIPSVSESADTSSSSVKPAETETAGSLKPEQEVGEVTSIRRYVSSSDMFSEPYLPELVLNPDGTFILTENLFEGMGHYSGTYTAEDYNLTLHVSSVDFSGFAGDDVKEIRFEALSEDALELMNDLCGSMKSDMWYLREE